MPRYLLRSTNTESRAAVCTGTHYPRVAAQIASETRALDVYIRMLHNNEQWEQKLFPYEKCEETEVRLPQVKTDDISSKSRSTMATQ